MPPHLPVFTWVKMSGNRLYNCFLPTSDTMNTFVRTLDALVASATTYGFPVLIGGDFIALTTDRGNTKTNHYGCALLEVFARL